MPDLIQRINVLVQRDGRVWSMPDRTQLGTVIHEARGRTPNRGWRFRCADCSSLVGAIRRTRREAVTDHIEHWNEGKG